MGVNFKYDVFVSHSSKDKTSVRELAARLKSDGLRVWLDEWEIKPGDLIGLKIEHGLEQSRTLILVMSDNAFSSDWVTLERHTLLFRDPTNAERRFIPLRLDGSEIKDIIKQFAYIDWRNKSSEEYEKLLLACKPQVQDTGTKATKKPLKKSNQALEGHSSEVMTVAITPDGRWAISGANDRTVRVWDLNSRLCVGVLKGHTNKVIGVAITPDGETIVSSSHDKTIRIWERKTNRCLSTLIGHMEEVIGVAVTNEGKTVISGSWDKTVRVWNARTGECTNILRGHSSGVVRVAVTGDGKYAISGAIDYELRIWDLRSFQCIGTLKGHTQSVLGIAITPDGKKAISGSDDGTVRLWDLKKLECLAKLEGHDGRVSGVAFTNNGRYAVSGSKDRTVRIWDLETSQCLAILEGHTEEVTAIAVMPDGRRAISASRDSTLRIWDISISVGAIRNLKDTESTQYTNAKIVLVGESGAGKTGLALRLSQDKWEVTESTHGMLVSQIKLPMSDLKSNVEREVWLWDFAGQPDYRLIHQLYMDETALGLLVFDPQDDNPFEGIGDWEKALSVATKYKPVKLLVAARCDRGGITISKKRFDRYCKEHNFNAFLNTSAKTGEGCDNLKQVISKNIPWDRLPWTATTKLFKSLKDAIIKLKEDDTPLIRLPELRQRLQLVLPGEIIGADKVRAVVGLMQGQGMLQMLDFGDFVLLHPEQINRYASIVVRMAREHADEMGAVPEQIVLDGRLDFKDMKRLAQSDEKILLRAMVEMFLNRSLSLREQTPIGTMLIFPSYFRRDKPDLPEHPNVFVTYVFAGPLDEIYSTLVVRLSYSDDFKKDQLWKDAADFKTHGGRRVGLAMKKKPEGSAELIVYFENGVPDDTKVTFIKYVHEHLLQRAQQVTRVRTYVCPGCDTPVENRKAIQLRLEKGLKDIICGVCEKRVPLLDLIENKFSSDEFLRRVQELDARARINLDNESRELILVGHAFAIAGEAGQIFRPIPNSDWGIDGEIEFKNYQGEASGERVYLQLKSGDSYLYKRQRDGAEVFTIKNRRHATYWQKQAYPVMLVVRTSDGYIRWMNVSECLKELRQKSKKVIKQIIFQGESFTATNLMRLRDKLIPPPRQPEKAR